MHESYQPSDNENSFVRSRCLKRLIVAAAHNEGYIRCRNQCQATSCGRSATMSTRMALLLLALAAAVSAGMCIELHLHHLHSNGR